MTKRTVSRRDFVKTSALAGLGLSLNFGLSSCMKDAVTPYLSTIGLQLWSVRDQLASDPEATLKAIKNYGYKQVELTRVSNYPKYEAILKDLDLKVYSSHFNWKLVTGNWGPEEEKNFPSFDHLLEAAHKIGMDSLVMGYWGADERQTLDDYKRLADQLNVAGEKCQKAGIQFGYHNHNFEFLPMEGSTGFEVLEKRMDPAMAKFELDVFWCSIAGIDPLAKIKDLEGRLHWLHLKDKKEGTQLEYDNGKVPHEAYQPLGKGILDMPAILDLASKVGVKYCMVEQDYSPSMIEDIGTSLDYLKTT